MHPMRYLRWPLIVTVGGVTLAVWLGWQAKGAGGALSYGLIAAVLAVLEISLSFDNAIVNADKLKTMAPKWRARFLTWGILIAVFGMRVLFPLLVVVVAAHVSPWEALQLAVVRPAEYAHVIEDSDTAISAFGGAFLLMVGLTYFIDEGKDVDWIAALEKGLRKLAPVRGMQISVVLAVVLVFAMMLDGIEEKAEFLFSALFGLVVFTAVEIIGHLIDNQGHARGTAAAGGAGAFLYLEILDASFSFDGVIGAFALTQNLFLIAIGLGIGAMYVRAMTIMLVERQTLAHFRYLEHGAYYSIVALSLIMFAKSQVEVPEAVTGLIGAGMIGLALISSIRARRLPGAPAAQTPPTAAARTGDKP